MIKDKRNIIYIAIIIIVLVITIGITFTFAYINRPTSSGNTNLITNITDIKNAINMSYSGDANMALNITLDDLSIMDAKNDYSSYISATSNITINFNANTSIYSRGASCDYSIKYTPITTFNATSAATSAGLRELTLSGSNNVSSFSEYPLTGVNSAVTLYSSSIATSAGVASTSQTWTFTMKFYNLNVNQASVIGQKPEGKISVVPGDCRAL